MLENNEQGTEVDMISNLRWVLYVVGGVLLMGRSLLNVANGETSFLWSPYSSGFRMWRKADHPVVFWICVIGQFLVACALIAFAFKAD